MMINARPRHRLILPVLAFATLAGCGGGAADKAEKDQQKPPPLVQVVKITASDVPNIVELPGRIEAIRTAEVRARVDGIVQRRLYEEGSDVRAGAALFQIDPSAKRAALQQALATLSRAQAARDNAQQVTNRYAPLVGRKAISAQENDAAVSELRQAEANVAQARAAVDAARLELGYTLVRAPISGRAGQVMVTEGALVSAAGATLMTKVDQLNPVYATFTTSSADVQRLQRDARSGALRLPGSLDRIPVRLLLETGDEYGITGYLDFAGQAVDPQTGSQALRARFDNPLRVLLPGQFIRGRIQAGIAPNGISVPQRAVQIADSEARVTVVGGDNAVTIRTVELGAMVNGRWAIRSGLKPGERVIVEGWQNLQSGQKVRVQTDGRSAGGPRQGGAPAVPADR